MGALLDWTKIRFQRSYSAYDEYTVTGTSDGRQACAAVPAQRGSSHRWDAFIVAQEPSIVDYSPTIVRVGVTYVPIRSIQNQPQENDPILEPLRYRWEMGNSSEPVDHDVTKKNPLVNSAGDPFETQPTCEFGTLFLTVKRNERSYDPGIALTYQNTINSDQFFGAAKGQCRCLSIMPDGDYPRGATVIPVLYHFEFRADGFVHRFIDQGPNGRFDDNGKKRLGPFHYPKKSGGQRCSIPVKLDGTGLPIDQDAGLLVGLAGQTPVAFKTPAGATPERGDGCFFLKFDKFNYANFQVLGLQ